MSCVVKNRSRSILSYVSTLAAIAPATIRVSTGVSCAVMSKSRKSRTRNWVGRQSRDTFVRKAREAGYASRAAWKLEEIDRRERILKPGTTVIDLGAAPGSWSQYASSRVGETGKVVAVDRNEFSVSNVVSIYGDICEDATVSKILEALDGELADLLLSDMAPDITGIRVSDEARFEELLLAVEAIAEKCLRPGGRLIVKLFQGPAADEFRHRIKSRFDTVSARKPVSSRSKSREYFASCAGFRPIKSSQILEND